MSALAATRIPSEGAGPTQDRHAHSCTVDVRSLASHVRIDKARKAAPRSAIRRAPSANQVSSRHRIGLIVVSNSPTKPTSSPDSDKHLAISNAASPPDE